MAALFAVVAGLVQLPPVTTWDTAFSRWLQGPPKFALTVIGFITDWLFSAQTVTGLAVITCLGFAFRRHWRISASAGLVFPVILLELALKYLIHQPPASSTLEVRTLLRSSAVSLPAFEHGFPSGHAARAAFMIGWLALVLMPARQRSKVAIAIACLTLFVGWTRIYVGDHTFLEIIGGLLLAGMFLTVAAAFTPPAAR